MIDNHLLDLRFPKILMPRETFAENSFSVRMVCNITSNVVLRIAIPIDDQ